MPTLRYQMPTALADRAKSNLAQTDASVSRFNDVADRVSRMPYAPITAAERSGPTTYSQLKALGFPGSEPSFRFPSIGGPVDTSIGAPVSAFKEPTISGTTKTANTGDSSNWRFRSFGQSQLGNGSETATNGAYASNPSAYTSNPDAYSSNSAAYGQQVSPVVTPSNPSGVGTPVSSPVVPPNYQPKDMSAQQKLYGWGSSDSQEE